LLAAGALAGSGSLRFIMVLLCVTGYAGSTHGVASVREPETPH
jgi:hypothetical protein